MARITQSFTYALPTELYVSGISTTKTGTYTYIGPDQFDVEIDGQGKIVMIDAKAYPSPERKKTINANEAAQLPVAYLARGHVDEDDFEWVENYTDEVLDNGDVYKGEWKNGKKSGKGIFTWNSGNIYEGNWINGKRTGNGVMAMSNGEKWAVKILSLPN